jgi:hypothetical protein
VNLALVKAARMPRSLRSAPSTGLQRGRWLRWLRWLCWLRSFGWCCWLCWVGRQRWGLGVTRHGRRGTGSWRCYAVALAAHAHARRPWPWPWRWHSFMHGQQPRAAPGGAAPAPPGPQRPRRGATHLSSE